MVLGDLGNLQKFALLFLVGYGLIVLGARYFSSGLQVLGVPLIRRSINLLSLRPTLVFFSAVGLSFFVQSTRSSATMAVSYAHSGLLGFRQLVIFMASIALGAVPLLLFFTLPITSMAPWFGVIGFFLLFYAPWTRLVQVGRVVFGLGLMLFAFYLWEANSEIMTEGFSRLNALYQLGWPGSGVAVFVGILVWMIILPSSLPWVAVLIHVSTIPNIFFVDLLLVLVAILTCRAASWLPIVLKSSYKAKRAAGLFMISLGFTSVLFLLFLESFTGLVAGTLELLGLETSRSMFIPFSYVFFALVNGVLLAALYAPLKTLMFDEDSFLKNKKPQRLQFFGSTSFMAPTLAIEQAFQELKKMSALTASMIDMTRQYVSGESDDVRARLMKYEKITDRIQVEVYDFLARVMEVSLTHQQGRQIRTMLRMVKELESMADACKSICLYHDDIRTLGVDLSPEFMKPFDRLLDDLAQVYEVVFNEITGSHGLEPQEFQKQAARLNKRYKECRLMYLEWIEKEAGSDYNKEAGLKLLDMLSLVVSIRNLAENIMFGFHAVK